MSSSTLERPTPTTPTTPTGSANAIVAWLERLWSEPRVARAVVVLAAVVWGLGSAWLTPRGPLTPLHVVVTTAAVLVLGLFGGLVLGSRWSMLLLPIAYAAAFELGRLGAAGATVDAIDVGSMLGAFAFVVGRGAHGLMVFPPMLFGAGAGVWLAARAGHPTAPTPGVPGILTTGLLAILVVAMTAWLVVPGTTAPILGPDGAPLEGSVAELTTVEIGGVDQVLLVRGRDVDNPVLLHLAGGPGGTDLGAMRADTGLESDFVVATWEQRGTGKSYATSIDPVEDLTLEQAVADTLEVVDHLRERFGQDRIYLTANSWGTIPSVLAVQEAPEKFHAYIGTGQMVNNRITDQLFYEDTLAWAEERGDDALVEQMLAAGPPPYEDLTNYQFTAGYEHQWNDYPGVENLSEMPFNTFVPENNLLDRINALRGMFDVNWFVYPQLQDHDFRQDAVDLEVPVWMVLGEHEARGRAELAEDWFLLLDAPAKHRVIIQDAGHRPSFEQPAEFAELLREVVALTQAAT